jgi:hypothetical protein
MESRAYTDWRVYDHVSSENTDALLKPRKKMHTSCTLPGREGLIRQIHGRKGGYSAVGRRHRHRAPRSASTAGDWIRGNPDAFYHVFITYTHPDWDLLLGRIDIATCNLLEANGGSVCESNAPTTSEMPPAGFEDREDHRTPCASVIFLSHPFDFSPLRVRRTHAYQILIVPTRKQKVRLGPQSQTKLLNLLSTR